MTVDSEFVSLEASFRESVIMGLRMQSGVSRNRLFERYGIDLEKYYGAVLIKLVKQKLIELTDCHLKLTSLGRRFANQIMADLV